MKRFRLNLFATMAILALSLSWRPADAQQPGRGIGAKRPETRERRIALVIGNSNYHDSPLKNPANDAREMIALLEKLGFIVISGLDADLRKMEELIDTFGREVKQGGVGLFYFAGHGVQVNGENYLIPIGAQITAEAEIKYKSVAVGIVLAKMEDARNGLNVIILDACRNNPFARSYRSGSQGLAKIDAPTGSIIAYATQPGNVASDGAGSNGLYTGELLAQLRVPGLSIEEVFKQTRDAVMRKTNDRQVPWEATSLRRAFYPNGGKPAGGLGPELSPEEVYWQVIAGSERAEDFNEYLRKYPNGRYADAAQARLRNQYGPPTNTPTNRGGEWILMADKSVEVSATTDWTDSFIKVQKGDQIEMIATRGQINLGRNGYAGPDGISAGDGRKPMSDCPTGALLARIESGNPVCAGSRSEYTAPAAGRLLFGLNESSLQDNTGSFVVRIRVNQFKR